jgi:DNA-binding transcriptional ArsR family regulator
MKSTDTASVRRNVYDALSEVVTVFASPARLKIVQILAQAPRSVDELSRETGESTANTSQHLQRLAKARVVACERRGVSRVYRITNPHVIQLWEDFQNLGHELDPMLNIHADTLTDASLRAKLPVADLLNEVRAGKAILMDVREEKESTATPVNHAVAIPLIKLNQAKSAKELNLPKSKPIYVLCRGRYCSLATNAVRTLRKWGCNAYRLQESSYRLNTIGGSKS